MRLNRSKIIDAMDEVLAWSRGECALTMHLPNGTRTEMTVREYEAFRLGERHEGSGRNPADAHSKIPPQKEQQHEP